MPEAPSAFTASPTRAPCPSTFKPPSVVTSWRDSGTRQQSCGSTFCAMRTISSVTAISRFMRVCRASRITVTSRSWMCRRSSRRCRVMLSAPASSASSAAYSGIGIAAAARLAQRRHMIDVHAERDARMQHAAAHELSSGACPRFTMAQGQHDLARFQGAAVETGIDGRAQHPLGIAQRAGIAEALRLQIGQRLTIDGAGRLGHAGLRTALQRRTDSTDPARTGAPSPVLRQFQAVTQVIQQALLEAAQRRLLDLAVAQRLHAGGVGEENLRMRIAALGQLQQQLVQIESAHEPLRREAGDRTVDLRRHQLAGLALAGPGHQHPLEGPQHALSRWIWARWRRARTRSAGHARW